MFSDILYFFLLGCISMQDESSVKSPPEITKHSDSRALALAERLHSVNARMFGAYWCSHCYNQKQALGKEAYDRGLVEYVECAKDGSQSQFRFCREKDVPGYPTWEIDGKLYPGEKSVEELERLLTSKGL
jgi:hypothetical protein